MSKWLPIELEVLMSSNPSLFILTGADDSVPILRIGIT